MSGLDALTVTAVHAPQLFTSLVSVIVPTKDAFTSVHARTYLVPAEVNVCEKFTVPDVPAARIGLETVPITVAPVPAASVAVWNILLNVAPVERVPELVIVEDSVVAVFAVAVVGVTELAVRSMPGAVHCTLA